MPDEQELIFDSPASDPDDEFWLEQGRQMVTGSLTSVRSAATYVMSGVGAVKGLYLGILGFADFVPETLSGVLRMLFLLPLACWLVALYFCVGVMKTRQIDVRLNSPSEIRAKSSAVLLEKQHQLDLAFWFLAAGLLVVGALLIYRPGG